MRLLTVRLLAAHLVVLLFSVNPAYAAVTAPWGQATALEKNYSRQKVVYDVTAGSVAALTNLLDRASFLSQLNGADPFENKIVLVIHGDAIPFFAIKNYSNYQALMARAYSLSVGGIIEFRLCRAAARLAGFQPQDFHGFITPVPMADAEIIDLQHQGYAYMR